MGAEKGFGLDGGYVIGGYVAGASSARPFGCDAHSAAGGRHSLVPQRRNSPPTRAGPRSCKTAVIVVPNDLGWRTAGVRRVIDR